MKKLISTITSLLLILSIFIIPVFGADTTTPSGVSVQNGANQIIIKALQNSLNKAQDQLNKLIQQQTKQASNINEAIAKAKQSALNKQTNASTALTNGTALEEKWKDALDKAAVTDKQELDNLNADIQKWTDSKQKQLDSLKKELSDIDNNLAKQLANLDKKLSTAKDDATKQSINNAKINIQNYASQRKAAVNTYLTTLQNIFTARQNIWTERKNLLVQRQTADTVFRNSMSSIKTTELNDKLSSLSQTQNTSNTDIEASVRAKYQKSVDSLNSRVLQLQALIKDIQEKLNNK